MNSLLCSLGVGLSVATAAYLNQANYDRAINFIERDLYERLRSLRMSTRHLRLRIQVWQVIVLATFCAYGLPWQRRCYPR